LVDAQRDVRLRDAAGRADVRTGPKVGFRHTARAGSAFHAAHGTAVVSGQRGNLRRSPARPRRIPRTVRRAAHAAGDLAGSAALNAAPMSGWTRAWRDRA